MNRSGKYSRRRFLQSTAAAGAALAVPYFVPQRAWGANERVLTGHIGMGGQGGGNLRAFLNQAIAVCDVDRDRLAKAVKRVENEGRSCAAFTDYRRLLDRADIDAVVISTPDHWHALPTIHACQAGKDVYCEKPLSLTIGEGRAMVQAARRNQRVVQTGSQQRSADNFRLACELVRNGRIGELQEVLVGIARSNHPGAPVPDGEPPAALDYDRWLGPAPYRPYNAKRVHYNFRFFWDYSGGQMTNWGAHHIDIAHWGMGMDESGPTRIWGEATFHPQNWHDVTETCRIHYEYAGGIRMTVGQRQEDIPMGTTFIGTKGRIYVNRGKLTSEPDSIIKEKIGDDEVRLVVSKNHHRNFLDCVASRDKPVCDVEIGHRSATACHLGNIAVRLGREIRWDPGQEQIIGDAEARAMQSRPRRSPYTV